MRNVNEMLEELKNSLESEVLDLFDEAVGYNEDSYICDVITEVSDSNVNIYNSDLLKWSADNYSYIEDAISEFGFAKNSEGEPDFIKCIQQGQYLYYKELFYDNLDSFIQYYKLNYLKDNGIIEIDDQIIDDVESTSCDDNSTLQDVIDEINEILKEGNNQNE